MNDISNYPYKIWAQNKTVFIEGIDEPAAVEILTVMGQIVYKQVIHKNTSVSIPTGTYIVRVSNQIFRIFVH
jgi:hypothetical protein